MEKVNSFKEMLIQRFSIPSNELKQRLNNKQIKINDNPIKSFELLESEIGIDFNGKFEDLGSFLTDLDSKTLDLILNGKAIGIDFKLFFGTQNDVIPPNYLLFLNDYILLSLSKKDHFVFKKINKLVE